MGMLNKSVAFDAVSPVGGATRFNFNLYKEVFLHWGKTIFTEVKDQNTFSITICDLLYIQIQTKGKYLVNTLTLLFQYSIHYLTQIE